MVHLPLFGGVISKNEVLSKELFLVLEERKEYNQDRNIKHFLRTVRVKSIYERKTELKNQSSAYVC